MSQAKTKAAPTDELRQPSEVEAAAIRVAIASRERRPARVTIGLKPSANKVMAISNPHTDGKGWGAHLTDTFGTSSLAFCDQALLRLSNIIADPSAVPTETQANAALALMGAIAPANELEAAIGEQIIAAHVTSLDFLRRARLNAGEYRDTAVAYGNLATKLSRTMAVQIEALAKLRNGGKQTVEVVYVDARGGRNNIIAGPLRAHEGGGRNGELPRSHGHAALPGVAAAPMPQVWCEEPARDAVPSAGDAE